MRPHHRRHNPPLAQHLAFDDLMEIARGLRPRLMEDPSEGAEFARLLLRDLAEGVAHKDPEGEYVERKKLATMLMDAMIQVEKALAIMHPRRNPERTIRQIKESREYKAGAAAYRRLDRSAKSDLGDQLVYGSFEWMDWFDDKPHPDFLRGFKDAWNPEEE